MNSHPARFEELERRLLSVEKQNRRLKQFGAALLILVSSLIVMGQAPSKKIVEANEFILRDMSGNVRARLSMDATTASPEMLLFDEKGKTRVKVTAGISFIGGGVTVSDGQGRERGVLSADDYGAVLSLLDVKGSPTSLLKSGEVEANEFVLKDESRNTRARLFVTAKMTKPMTIPGMNTPVPVTFNPKATLALYDEKEQASGMLDDDSISFFKSHISLGSGVLQIGDPTSAVVVTRYSVGLFDEQGFEATLGRSSLETARTGATQLTSAASLVMFDKNKNVIWKAP